MIRLSLAILVVTLVPTSVRAELNEASVRKFVSDWSESFNRNDPDRISAFYENDERVEMLVSKGLTVRGRQAIAESYEQDMKGVRFYDSEIQALKLRVFEKSALVSFVHRFKYEVRGEGTRLQIHIRTTMALHHTEAGWRIAMEHSSAIHGVERERVIIN